MEIKKNEELKIYKLNYISTIGFLEEYKKNQACERLNTKEIQRLSRLQCIIRKQCKFLKIYLNKSNTTLHYIIARKTKMDEILGVLLLGEQASMIRICSMRTEKHTHYSSSYLLY